MTSGSLIPSTVRHCKAAIKDNRTVRTDDGRPKQS